jgi:DNA mismatch endonuclease (patch repair protein)
MTDRFDRAKRSEIMSHIKGKDTRPERSVRSLLHRMGYRFRLHVGALPGKPDVVLPRHKKVIFVHGCFWHGHTNCKRAARPQSNTGFWNRKIESNIARDRRNRKALWLNGWDVLVVWQCQTKDLASLKERLAEFMGNGRE